jgi:hypothetical protein
MVCDQWFIISRSVPAAQGTSLTFTSPTALEPYPGIRAECMRQANDLHNKFKFVDGTVLIKQGTIQTILGTITISGLTANEMSGLGGCIWTYLMHMVSQCRGKATQKLLHTIKGTFGEDKKPILLLLSTKSPGSFN